MDNKQDKQTTNGRTCRIFLVRLNVLVFRCFESQRVHFFLGKQNSQKQRDSDKKVVLQLSYFWVTWKFQQGEHRYGIGDVHPFRRPFWCLKSGDQQWVNPTIYVRLPFMPGSSTDCGWGISSWDVEIDLAKFQLADMGSYPIKPCRDSPLTSLTKNFAVWKVGTSHLERSCVPWQR